MLECRICDAIPRQPGEIPQVQPFAGGIERTEKPLKSPSQIRSADKMRLGLFFMSLDQANRGPLRQQREKFLVVFRFEFKPRVKFQHPVRILRSVFRCRFLPRIIVGAGLALPALRLPQSASIAPCRGGRSELRPYRLLGRNRQRVLVTTSAANPQSPAAESRWCLRKSP